MQVRSIPVPQGSAMVRTIAQTRSQYESEVTSDSWRYDAEPFKGTDTDHFFRPMGWLPSRNSGTVDKLRYTARTEIDIKINSENPHHSKLAMRHDPLAEGMFTDAVRNGTVMKFALRIVADNEAKLVLISRGCSHEQILAGDCPDAAGEIRMCETNGNLRIAVLTNKSGTFQPPVDSMRAVLTFAKYLAAINDTSAPLRCIMYNKSNEVVVSSGDQLAQALASHSESEESQTHLSVDHFRSEVSHDRVLQGDEFNENLIRQESLNSHPPELEDEGLFQFD